MIILKKNTEGFTLIEVIITLAIFAVMMEALYATMTMSQRSLDVYTQTTAPKQNLRMAMAAMVRELREAQNPLIDTRHRNGDNDHSIVLSFQRPLYGDVKYSWTDTGDDAGKILRTNNSKTNVLAYHITSLSFTAPTTSAIIVQISDGTTQNAAVQLSEIVALRMQTGLFAESQNETIK